MPGLAEELMGEPETQQPQAGPSLADDLMADLGGAGPAPTSQSGPSLADELMGDLHTHAANQAMSAAALTPGPHEFGEAFDPQAGMEPPPASAYVYPQPTLGTVPWKPAHSAAAVVHPMPPQQQDFTAAGGPDLSRPDAFAGDFDNPAPAPLPNEQAVLPPPAPTMSGVLPNLAMGAIEGITASSPEMSQIRAQHPELQVAPQGTVGAMARGAGSMGSQMITGAAMAGGGPAALTAKGMAFAAPMAAGTALDTYHANLAQTGDPSAALTEALIAGGANELIWGMTGSLSKMLGSGEAASKLVQEGIGKALAKGFGQAAAPAFADHVAREVTEDVWRHNQSLDKGYILTLLTSPERWAGRAEGAATAGVLGAATHGGSAALAKAGEARAARVQTRGEAMDAASAAIRDAQQRGLNVSRPDEPQTPQNVQPGPAPQEPTQPASSTPTPPVGRRRGTTTGPSEPPIAPQPPATPNEATLTPPAPQPAGEQGMSQPSEPYNELADLRSRLAVPNPKVWGQTVERYRESLRKRIADIESKPQQAPTPAPPAPAQTPEATTTLRGLVDDYDTNGFVRGEQNATDDDFINAVEGHLHDEPNEKIERAIDQYRRTQDEDASEFGLRGDSMGEAESLVSLIRAEATKPEEPPSAAPATRPVPAAPAQPAPPADQARPQGAAAGGPAGEPPVQAVQGQQAEPAAAPREVAPPTREQAEAKLRRATKTVADLEQQAKKVRNSGQSARDANRQLKVARGAEEAARKELTASWGSTATRGPQQTNEPAASSTEAPSEPPVSEKSSGPLPRQATGQAEQPAAESTRSTGSSDQSSGPSHKPTTPTGPRPFTRSDLEARIRDAATRTPAHEVRTGQETQEANRLDAGESLEATGNVDTPADAFTYRGRMPGELRDLTDGRPDLRRKLTRTDQAGRSGWEEHYSNVGPERYKEQLEGLGRQMDQALDDLRTSQDPEHRFLAALHDNMPEKGSGPAKGALKPGDLPKGATFTINGEKFEVKESKAGYLVLKDGQDYPVTPVEAMTEIPADKGSLKGGSRAAATTPPPESSPASPSSRNSTRPTPPMAAAKAARTSPDEAPAGPAPKPAPSKAPQPEKTAPSPEPTAPKPGKLAKATALADRLEAEGLAALKANRLPPSKPGQRAGGTTIPGDIEALAKIAAARMLRLGAKSLAGLSNIIARAIAEHAPHLKGQEADVETRARAILANPEGKATEPKLGEPAPTTSPTPEPEASPEPGSEPDSFGIKNAAAQVDRLKLGAGDFDAPTRRSMEEMYAAGQAEATRDPTATEKLVNDLRNDPEKIVSSDKEAGLLLKHKIDLENALKDGIEAHQKAKGDKGAQLAAWAHLTALRAQILELTDLTKRTGTASARALAARNMMSKLDYSLSSMEARRTAAKGSPLTEGELAKVLEEHRALKAAMEAESKAKDAALEAAAKAEHQAYHERLMKEAAEEKLKTAKAAQPRRRPADRFLSVLHSAADQARARIKARTTTLRAGFDPTEFADHIIVGADHLASGIVKLADWSAKMLGEFGDSIKQHIDPLFEASKKELQERLSNQPEDVKARLTPKEPKAPKPKATTLEKLVVRAKDGDQPETLRAYFHALALEAVRGGSTAREAILDKVHAQVKGLFPGITREQTRDTLSGYGDFRPLDKEKAKAILRQRKGEMQKLAQLEALKNKQAPKATGMERQAPSDEARQLQKEVNEAKKAAGLTPASGPGRLKTLLESTKTRIKNQIKDLETELDTGTRLVRGKPTALSDPELDTLRKRLATLREAHDAAFKKPGLTDAQRLDLATKAAQKSADAWEQRAKEAQRGNFAGKPRSARPSSPEIDAARARAEHAKAEFESLKAADPAQRASEEAQGNADYRARMAEQEADLLDRLARQDFAPRPAPERLRLDPQSEKARARTEEARQRYEEGNERFQRKNRPAVLKAADWWAKWRRAMVLSHISVLGKLAAAAGSRVITSPAESLGQYAAGRALPALGAKASVPHTLKTWLRAETAAQARFWTEGMRGSARMLKGKRTNLELAHGAEHLPPEVTEYLGRLHGALKNPTKEAAYARALTIETEHSLARGENPTDPSVQMRNANRAYKAAESEIFQEDNKAAEGFNGWLRQLESPDKETGKPQTGMVLASAMIRYALPIIKVPLNYFRATTEVATGLPVGIARTIHAYAKGIDTLKPVEASAILRQLSRGSIGAAFLLLGYFNPKSVGGYYQHGEKREEGEAQAGGVRIFGHNLPRLLLHNPFLEAMHIGATARRVADSQLHKNDQDPQGVGAGITAASLGLIEEIPFVREGSTVGDLMDPLKRDHIVWREATSLVIPGAVEDVARWLDRSGGEAVRRKPTSLKESLEASIPGLRQRVPEAPEPGTRMR